jgi:two-component system response regulator RegX3
MSLLIVEDDASTLSLLAAVARREGFDALLAADGESALGFLAANSIDLMLLDMLLPRLSGFDILRHLKSNSPKMLDRTIVITAAADSLLRNCHELSLTASVFRKPIDLNDLVAEMHRCSALVPK